MLSAAARSGPPVAVKKFLTIGINYSNARPGEGGLVNCVNDSRTMCRIAGRRFDVAETRCLLDEGPGHAANGPDPECFARALPPTRANMEAAFEWLVAGAQPGDNLVVHYSGHGAYAPDKTGAEADGYNETLCPYDFETAGMIEDDQIHGYFGRLPEGVTVLWVSDCCHSGSNMDGRWSLREARATAPGWKLAPCGDPHFYLRDPAVVQTQASPPKWVDLDDPAAHVHVAVVDPWGQGRAWATPGDLEWLNGMGLYPPALAVAYWSQNATVLSGDTGRAAFELKERANMAETEAQVFHLAACRDDQTAADGVGNSGVVPAKRNGMFTAAWEMAMDAAPAGSTPLADLLVLLRRTINDTFGGEQVVQLSAGRKCAVSDAFPF